MLQEHRLRDVGVDQVAAGRDFVASSWLWQPKRLNCHVF